MHTSTRSSHILFIFFRLLLHTCLSLSLSPCHSAMNRLWESKHLNPAWDFEQELGRKVRSLLSLMDHPINMAHMAKLFTSQLILSCNFNVSVLCFDTHQNYGCR